MNQYLLFWIGLIFFTMGLVGIASCVYTKSYLFATLYGVSCLFMFVAAAYPFRK